MSACDISEFGGFKSTLNKCTVPITSEEAHDMCNVQFELGDEVRRLTGSIGIVMGFRKSGTDVLVDVAVSRLKDVIVSTNIYHLELID